MRFTLILGLIFFATETTYSQTLGKDTLHYYEITLETSCYIYFFPNGKYLCCYDQQNMDFRQYGDWVVLDDSIRVNIKYLHNYIGRREMEERIDTSYYETFLLNSNRRPVFTDLRFDNPQNHPLPKDIFFDKLR